MGRKIVLSVLLALGFLLVHAQNREIKVACVGNSITYGSGIANREQLSYPAQLQNWLGGDYVVRNFGVSGATMLKKGNKPYWKEPEFVAVKEFLPDIILIKLGTNDSKPMNWQYSKEFRKDYQEMITTFSKLSSRPRIILLTPAPVFTDEKWGITRTVVADEIAPIIRKLAESNRLDLVDLHESLQEAGRFFPDQIHPDPLACELMVEQIYITLFHKTALHRGKAFNTATHAVPSPEYRGAAAGWGEGKDWFSQHNDINRMKEDRAINLVFLGNSITQGWGGSGRSVGSKAPAIWDSLYAPRQAANFGISGDRTQHLLWRIRNGNFDGLSPVAIVVTIGVNNFRTNTSEEIAAGIAEIVKELTSRMPKTKILLLGPLPAGANPEHPYRVKYEEVHQQIQSLYQPNRVDYVKISSPFILDNGQMNPELMAGDHIHLNPAGYVAWAQKIEPYLEKYFEDANHE